MDNIKSFELDHNTMTPGFYCLGEAHDVTTYDMRFKYPNKGDYISYAALHSIEHLFAVVIRNSDIKDKVVYFGPMGCRTGFYLLLWKTSEAEAKQKTIECLEQCLSLDYVPGTKPIECGNCKEHNLAEAQQEIANYLKVIKA
ncbi:MAG: S-ribosylhomocysteine lyase [Clostridia bacterium]